MEMYGQLPPRRFTVSHILWPLLAVCLAAVLYLFIINEKPASLTYNNTAPRGDGRKQIVIANVMAAFDEINLPAEDSATTTPDEPQVPETSRPVLTPKPAPKTLTKVSTKIALPKAPPKFNVSLPATTTSVATTSAAVAATTSVPVVAKVSTNTPATSTPAATPVATTSPQAPVQNTATTTATTTEPYVAQISGSNYSAPAPAPAPAEPEPEPVPVATVPGSPTGLAGVAGNSQVSLSWTAPASNGGSGLTDYEIRQSNDNFASNNIIVNDGTGTSSVSYVVTGLTNGTTYYFKVSAVNSVGTSPASDIVNATPAAPVTVPGAPTGLSATAGDTTVDLSWTAPASDGGSAITDYEIHYSTDNFASDDQTFAHAVSTATAVTVTGLTNDTAYHFIVKAVNAVGTGPASATAGPATPAGAAPPPPPPPGPEGGPFF